MRPTFFAMGLLVPPYLLGLSLCISLLVGGDLQAGKRASMKKHSFGKTGEGEAVDLYEMTNAKGMVVKIITYGGIITELHVPDKSGKVGNVVLGHDNLKSYLDGHPYFGALVGRLQWWMNRIAKGTESSEGGGWARTLFWARCPTHIKEITFQGARCPSHRS